MAIIISNDTVKPQMYGAEGEGTENVTPEVAKANIQFGKGSIDKVLAKVGDADGNVYFGNDTDTGSGIVVADGNIVSSKILNVVATEEEAATYYTEGDDIPEGKNVGDVKTELIPASITITYIDDDNKISTSTINVPGADLESRVSAIEALVYADENSTIDKLQEVLTWFAQVSDTEESYKVEIGEGEDSSTVELGVGQLGLLTTVAENKLAIEELKTVIDNLDVTEETVGDGNVKVTYSEEDGIVTISDVTVDETTVTFTAATEAVEASEGVEAVPAKSANLSIPEDAEGVEAGTEAKKLLTGQAIAQIKAYVDAVAEANQEGVTIAEGSEDYLSVDDVNDHKIGVKTTALGDAVGMTKDVDEDGNVTWKKADGTVGDAPGLATAADVAAEIVADEEVIAAALNDHELRINALQAKEITIESETAASGIASDGKAETTVEATDDLPAYTIPAVDELTLEDTAGKTTYTIKNGEATIAPSIVVYNEETVQALLDALQAERIRANEAEAKLQAQISDHENRLTWIELND